MSWEAGYRWPAGGWSPPQAEPPRGPSNATSVGTPAPHPEPPGRNMTDYPVNSPKTLMRRGLAPYRRRSVKKPTADQVLANALRGLFSPRIPFSRPPAAAR